ncbi:MAG: DUF885 domain-containing protein [Lutibacter sp.]|nr:DUF885 domain-containing protein [Lutibacter sp.]
MKKLFLGALLTLVTFTSCKNEIKKVEAKMVNKAFNDVLDTYNEENYKLFPLNATYAGETKFNDQLPNNLTNEFSEKLNLFYTKTKADLFKFNENELSENEILSKGILIWECDVNLERLNFKEDLMPINQFYSITLTIGQFAGGTSAQPFMTVKDYNNWLKRLNLYVNILDTAEVKMREGIQKGYVLPKSLIVKIIPQLENLAINNIENHLFYSPVKNMPDLFSTDEKKNISDAYFKIIEKKIVPAHQKLANFFKNEYLKAGRESSGISDIPNGNEYYNFLIKYYTTTNMTAEEIHNLGLSEVEKIKTEMEKIKTQVGFKGDLKSFFNHVRNRKELMPFTKPQQVIDNFNAIHDKMKPQIEKLFEIKPKTHFKVRRTEAFREASASAEYNQGSLDGTRPGVFYVPIPNVTSYNMFSDEDLFLHEAIPGHHYQISLTQESTVLPKFRKTLWYSSYGEGWALYSESLGKELGLYTDSYQYFGMLSAEMHRAIRLVVDTGMHTKNWSREKAIQYSMDNEAESEASIISEIERYMAIPGQALSYKIGQLKIRELRSKAENELGDKFNIKEFHNQILETGCVPLKLLEEKIDNWIETTN